MLVFSDEAVIQAECCEHSLFTFHPFTIDLSPFSIDLLPHRCSLTVTEEQRSFALTVIENGKLKLNGFKRFESPESVITKLANHQITKLNWYVVYTRPRWEKKVSATLADRGIVHYCPLNKVQKQWSDRKKVVLEPLFKGYVFVQVDDLKKWDIKLVDGILNFVYWLGKPAVVKPNEIDTIRKFLQEFTDVEVVNASPDAQDKVVVKQGLLMNYKGIVVEVIGNKAKVNIESMGLQLSAVFDIKNLEVIR